MSTAPDSITHVIAEEARTKRKRIAASLWPKARLAAELLYHQITRDQVFTQASALTYKTLFSLIPIFVLSLLVLSTISAGTGKNALDATVQNTLLEQMGIDRMPLTDAAGNPMKNSDGSPATLSTAIQPYIERAKETVNGKSTGLVAFAVLAYGAISLMMVIESTFNQIYGSAKPRTLIRRIMLYWCVLTLGPIGIAATIVLGRSAYNTASSYAQSAWLLSMANVLTSFFISWILMLLLYRVIPDTPVKWRPALVGSFVAALAWELGKWAFGLYVRHAVRNSFYGSLALLPLFMFWIYITWCLILLGLEITYLQQYWTMLKREFFFTRSGKLSAPLSDIHWILPLGVLMYRRFKEGKHTDAHEAAEALSLPNSIVGQLLVALEQAGLLHCLPHNAYTLAKPAEAITAYDLLTAARLISRTLPEPPVVHELEAIEAEWAKGHTLVQLAETQSLTGAPSGA